MKSIDVAIGILSRDEKILVCLRKEGDTFGGYWEFPGGKCEPGEALADCLLRELREELDVTARVAEPLRPIHHAYPTVRLTLHPFLCDQVAGEPKLIECQAARWISPADLPDYRFPPANESLLREVAERLAPRARGARPAATTAAAPLPRDPGGRPPHY